MHEVVVYSLQGCYLCDVVTGTLVQTQRDADFRWREVDIDDDCQLQEKFNLEVPVVFIDGRKAFKFRMDRDEVSEGISQEIVDRNALRYGFGVELHPVRPSAEEARGQLWEQPY